MKRGRRGRGEGESGWCGDVGGGSYPMYNRLLTAGEINTVINNIR